MDGASIIRRRLTGSLIRYPSAFLGETHGDVDIDSKLLDYVTNSFGPVAPFLRATEIGRVGVY